MFQIRFRRPFILLIACVSLAYLVTAFAGCRFANVGWDEDSTEIATAGQIASGGVNPAWQQGLLTTQQALAEARAKDPTITWTAGDNAAFRTYSDQEIRNLAGDSGLTTIPSELINSLPVGQLTVIEVATGQTPSPDDLFALGGISANPGLRSVPMPGLRAAYVLPPSISWRNKDGKNWLTPVRRQFRYNTCSTFATLGAVESFMKIARADSSWTIDLSEAWLWYYGTARFNPFGGTPKPNSADGWDRNFACSFMLPVFGGVPIETVAPYEPFMANYSLFQNAPASPEKFTANALFAFKGTAAVKLALQKGPVIGSMDVDSFFTHYREGAYVTIATAANTRIGAHAILFVGYDDLDNTWEIKNSWGSDWGDQGYFRIRQNDPAIAVNRHAYLLSVPPEIIARSPVAPAVAPLDAVISVEFGEALRASSISSETFRIIDGETRQSLAGMYAIGSEGRRITFTPTQPLLPGRTIICTITTGIRSLDNDSLMQNHTWSFTTEGAAIASSPVAVFLATPETVSASTSARFQIGGIGIVAFRYRLDQGAFSQGLNASEPLLLTDLTDGEHVLHVIGQTASGVWQAEASATVFPWTVATLVGNAVILESPPQVSVTSDYAFTWTGEPGVVATKVHIDNAVNWSPEQKPTTLGTYKWQSSGLQNGTHSFQIITRNAAGTWQTPASATVYTWYVNTALGTQATLSGLPPRYTRTTSVQISVGGIDVDRYQYALDNWNFSIPRATGTPLLIDNLALGTHTLRVTAVDSIGASQPSSLASSYTWTILSPLAEFASTPEVMSGTSTARFIASGEEIIEVRHSLDGAAFGAALPATQPIILEGLTDGAHTFRLIGRNAAGAWQAEAKAASHTWTVSTGFGRATIVAGPASLTVSADYAFSWNVDPGVTATRVSLDDIAVWSAEILPNANGACATNGTLLAPGTHTFRIIARNTAGMWQPTASATVHSWYMNTVLGTPAVLATSTTQHPRMSRMTIAVSGPGISHYRYSLDNQAFSQPAPVDTPLALSGLSVGNHIVRVVSIDALEVVQPLSFAASLSWTVEPPLAEFTSTPASSTASTTARFLAGGIEIDEIRYRLDGAPFGDPIPATQPIVLEGLATGWHTLLLIGRNAAGTWQAENSATALAWTITQPPIQWQLGTADWDSPQDSVADAAGNVYFVGMTTGNLDGGVGFGGIDGFLTKVASNGSRLWTKQFGSAFLDEAHGVALAPDGDIVVVGMTTSSLPGQTSNGGTDLMLARFAPDGTQRWLRQHGYATSERGEKITVDATGTIHIVGLSSEISGQTGLMVMRFDAAGELQLRQSFAINLTDSAAGIAVDSQGNTIVTGGVTSTFNGQVPLGGVDCLVMKLIPNGDFAWTRFLGTNLDDRGKDVAIDAAGNIYISGETAGGLDGQASSGGVDAFLAKFDTNGNRLWVSQFGSAGNDSGSDLLLDATGAPYVSGIANGSLHGKVQIGQEDLFVTSWNAAGTRLWSGLYGTTGLDSHPRLARDGTHPFTLIGATEGALPGFTNAGNKDLILLRIDAQGAAR